MHDEQPARAASTGYQRRRTGEGRRRSATLHSGRALTFRRRPGRWDGEGGGGPGKYGGDPPPYRRGKDGGDPRRRRSVTWNGGRACEQMGLASRWGGRRLCNCPFFFVLYVCGHGECNCIIRGGYTFLPYDRSALIRFVGGGVYRSKPLWFIIRSSLCRRTVRGGRKRCRAWRRTNWSNVATWR